MKIAGTERFGEAPEKNKFSHICEAGGYMLLGGGEGKEVVKRVRPEGEGKRATRAETDYSIFG